MQGESERWFAGKKVAIEGKERKRERLIPRPFLKEAQEIRKEGRLRARSPHMKNIYFFTHILVLKLYLLSCAHNIALQMHICHIL